MTAEPVASHQTPGAAHPLLAHMPTHSWHICPPTPGTYAQPLGTASVHQGTTESCVGGVVSQAPGWAPCPSFSFGLKDCRTSRGVKEGPTVSHCFVCYHTAKSTQDNAGSMRSWFIPGGTFPWSPQRPGLVVDLSWTTEQGLARWHWPGSCQGDCNQLHMGPTSRRLLSRLKLFPLDSNSFLNLSFSCSLR